MSINNAKKRVILCTGGMGFIGSHLVRRLVTTYPQYMVINLDKLTSAGNRENVYDVDTQPNYIFIKGDVCDVRLITDLFQYYSITDVIHMAAERNPNNPLDIATTNVMGTLNLLSIARQQWNTSLHDHRFYYMSTDEVYGHYGDIADYFTETAKYDPHSPYAASKASAEHFVRAFRDTHGMPILISNCSNNYGPHQLPEKLIPMAIYKIKHKEKIALYEEGKTIHDWLFVKDHAHAVDVIFHSGAVGETYNINGNECWEDRELIYLLCEIMDTKLGRATNESRPLIDLVETKGRTVKRYTSVNSKIYNQLGWQPSVTIRQGLEQTIDWYLENEYFFIP